MPHPEFPLRTERLVLRPFTAADVDDVWAYQRQPEVARHMLWAAREREQTRLVVEEMAGEVALRASGDCLSLAVFWPVENRVVGQVELVWHSAEHRQGEVGYVFNPDHHGGGLATEAVREVLRLGFEEFGMHRIVGRCSARNAASIRLLERLGFRREAHFVHSMLVKNEWREELVYAQLRNEWRTHLNG